jgi:competence protein ComEC
MRFSDYPFLKYLPLLIGGILIGNNQFFSKLTPLWIGIGTLWLVYFFLVQLKTSRVRLQLLSLIGYLMILGLGILMVNLRKELSTGAKLAGTFTSYFAEVRQFDLQKPNSFENLLEIIAVKDSNDWKPASSMVIVYHQAKEPLRPGQLLKVNKAPEKIGTPKNPNEFDYRAFLARKGIDFRQFIGKDFQMVEANLTSTSGHFLVKFRNQLASRLQEQIPDAHSKQIGLALLLGQKQSLDRDLREGYVQAGVMHILAVSGLHVGIIYALFLGFLKPLKLSKKWSRLYLLFVVLLIWVYAIVTGLSPSVVRAATMFSLLSLGQMRDRKPSVFNILAFSAMLMISINPEVIYEVGFQLSYLAVAGIVLIQPLILNWWLPPNRVLEYLWQLTAVSIAAQLATFPLSVYYFHLFPTYFLLGNLLIIPLAFVIMQIGIPLLLLGWIPVVGSSLGWVLSKLIWCQNFVIQVIQDLPMGKIDRITISPFGMIVCWIGLLIWSAWALGNRKQLLYLVFSLVSIWSGMTLFQELNRPSQELVIYQGKKGQVFDFKNNNKLFSWNQGVDSEELSFVVDPNRIANQLPQIPTGMKGIPLDASTIQLFPSPIILNQQNSEIYFANQKPKEIAIWTDGHWLQTSYSDTLRLGEFAFRILF